MMLAMNRVLYSVSVLLLPAAFLCGQNSQAPTPTSGMQQDKFGLEVSHSASAVYPPEAVAKRIQGTVSITVAVSPTGEVERAEATDGDPLLQQVALAAARLYTFKSRKDGQYVPLKAWAQLIFDFTMTDAEAMGQHVSNPLIIGRLVHAEEFPKSLQVSEIAMQVTRVKMVPPIYPLNAGQPTKPGTVVLAAVIGTDGKIKDLHIVSGSAELANSAEEAVRQWEYKPYVIIGEPVQVETKITLDFGIDQSPLPTAVLQWMVENPHTLVEQILVHEDNPGYPEAAKQKGRQGGVVLEAKLDLDGKVHDLKVSRGDPLFNEAALAFAKTHAVVQNPKSGPAKTQVAFVVEFVK
jgi:TonB family protein